MKKAYLIFVLAAIIGFAGWVFSGEPRFSGGGTIVVIDRTFYDDIAAIFGTDSDFHLEYDSVNSWWQLGDGTNDFLRVTDAGTTGGFYILGNLGIGLTPVTGTRLTFPLEDDAVTPTLAFGDGDTGLYQNLDNELSIAIAGTQRHRITASAIYSATSSGYSLDRVAATSTNPAFTFAGDTNTGVGRAGVDQISLIAGGVEGMRIVEDTTTSMHLPETATPTAIANYGAFYPKDDNLPYFQDGDGVEHVIAETDTDYGEMYLSANGTATTIETAATPIALRLFTTGSLNDWTFDAGSTAAITVYANYGGTVPGTVLATSTHGLTTLDVISIRGTTNYNGIFQVTVVDGTHFYFTDTWVADDGASDFDQPSHLIAGANAAGKYAVAWNMSSSAGTGNDTFLFTVYNNTTAHATSRVDRKFANNDIGAFGGCGIITVAVGDWIFLTATNDGVGTITNAYGALVINRL